MASTSSSARIRAAQRRTLTRCSSRLSGFPQIPRGRSQLIFSCRADELAGGILAFRKQILSKWEQTEEQVLVGWLHDEESISRHEAVLRDFESEFGSAPIKN